MPSNTKNVKSDAASVPIPQYFNPITDDFEPLEGTGGGIKVSVTGTPNVAISGTPNVAVTSMPNVTIAGTPNVAISGTPNVNTVGSGQLKGAVQNVTTAGTRVQLAAYLCREVTIIAKKTNAGSIYVGGSDVSNTVYGVVLDANESFTFQVSNANLIYIDAAKSGEGVSYVAI